MTIHTALKKIDSLTPSELRHCIQRMDIELKNYERVVLNYSPYMMKRFGLPYAKMLEGQRQQFVNKLDEKETRHNHMC